MRGETVIFSRDRGRGRRVGRDADHPETTELADELSADELSADELSADELSADGPRTGEMREGSGDEQPRGGGRRMAPARGPYDSSDAPDDVERFDLGSLRIPVVDGVSVQVQANNDGVIQQVALIWQDSALMLSVLAAPRTEDIWDDVRADIRRELEAGGATVEEVRDRQYRRQLQARLTTPDGPVDLRFVGVDGPRWLLRAVFQGAAALDTAAAGPLSECLRDVVVFRGREALPVTEPLPLRLPKEVAEQARAQAAAAAAAAEHATNGVATAGRPAASNDGASRPRNV
jgi:hypothetical protein